MRRAIVAASPQVVIDQLTDLAQPLRPGGFGDWLKGTVALRRDVTPALVDAARDGGASRVIAQSAAFMTAPVGPEIVDESASLYLDAPEPQAGTITSNAALEAVVTRAEDIEGVVPRYGFLYGPGTYYAPDGAFVEQIRHGAFPIVGTGRAAFRSFTSTTRPPPRSSPSTMARPGPTTLSTTTQLRCTSGCRTLRTSSTRRRRQASRWNALSARSVISWSTTERSFAARPTTKLGASSASRPSTRTGGTAFRALLAPATSTPLASGPVASEVGPSLQTIGMDDEE